MDIAALARAGVNTVWPLIASELKACTLRSQPAASYNPTTDTNAITWGQTAELSAFIYGEKAAEKIKANLWKAKPCGRFKERNSRPGVRFTSLTFASDRRNPKLRGRHRQICEAP